ncbi:unnamed protein product [Jaminaea pallidilutea]
MLSFAAVAPVLALALLLALGSTAGSSWIDSTAAERWPVRSLLQRTLNTTSHDACKAIKFTSKSSSLQYPLVASVENLFSYYMLSSAQVPSCAVKPTSAQDLAAVLKVIGDRRISFAVTSGGHTGNPTFSSTNGILISMKGFQQVELSKDKKTVDIGPGNIWDNVYQVLAGTGVNVVGGRVSGVGVGGFLTGGGGFSWLTNQYGLTVDSLVQFDIVLPDGSIKTGVTSQSDPDLFFAVKGGGNRFGIVYNIRLSTVPSPKQVWGGLKTFTMDQLNRVSQATADFSAKNTDKKAQVIPAYNFLLGQPGVSLLAFYDGPSPPAGVFDQYNAIPAFTSDWKARSFSDLVRSAPSNSTAGQRGAFHTVSTTGYTKGLLEFIVEELNKYGSTMALHSGYFLSYDTEPFLQYPSKEAAWKHDNTPRPLNLYFAWSNPLDDGYWRNALQETAQRVTNKARSEGLYSDDLLLYPNYALDTTPVDRLYDAGSLSRLRQIRSRIDPKNVMGLTTFFEF